MISYHIIVTNDFGTFKSEIYNSSIDQYNDMLLSIAGVFNDPYFTMNLENGDYYLIGNELIRKSYFMISHIESVAE